MSAHADGAFAEYTLVDERSLLRLPDGIELRHAALAEPLAVALHGLTRGGVRAGQRLFITGAGPIGTLSIAAARARGVTEIVVSEPHPVRRALAERLGATAVDPETLVGAPRRPATSSTTPFDVALECSGHDAAMEIALTQLKRGGTLVLVGAGIKSPRFDANRILLNELVVTGRVRLRRRRLRPGARAPRPSRLPERRPHRVRGRARSTGCSVRSRVSPAASWRRRS